MAESDADLLTKAIAGDADALGRLLECHGPQVRQQLRVHRKWQSVLSADDVIQVTYLEAFLRIGHFTPHGEKSFRGWLRRIAENNLRDAIKELERVKRPQPQKRVEVPAGEDSTIALIELLGGTVTTPSRVAARREACHLMEKAIRSLPEDYQRVVQEHDLQGRSASDVASSMGRSRGAVFMLLARAHDRLKEALGSESKFFTNHA